MFSIIVFGCISSQGWLLDDKGKEYCIINNNGTACNFGMWLGVIAFLASMGFIVGEYFFEQMSSAKTRKHYVMIDLGFSGNYSIVNASILYFFSIYFSFLVTYVFCWVLLFEQTMEQCQSNS